MEAYTSFAQVYDLFQDNVPYEEWAAYLTALLKEYGAEDGLVLDLGCGTGSMTQLLAKAGYDMIGADNSEEMLEIAMENGRQPDWISFICCRICGSLNCTALSALWSVSAIP